MRVQYKLSLFFSSLFLVPSFAFATSVISTAPGGNSTTGYQATAPTFTNGDKIRGHAMFKKGFTIPESATVTWDGDGLVEGPITFAGGSSTMSKLTLLTDLRLGSSGLLSGAYCEITGNNNKIILGDDATMATNAFISDSIGNNLVIDGQGHAFNCPSIYGMGGVLSTITLKNMIFNVYDQYNDCGILNQYDHVLENITITGGKPSLSDFTTLGWVARSFTIRGRVALNMPGRRLKLNVYGHVNIVIERNSTLYIGKDTILEAIKSTDGGSIRFTMADETSVLHLDGCDFYTGANGLSLTKGTVIFENKVRIFNKDYDGASNADTSKALIFGDGTVAGDVNVRVLGGAYVTVDGCIKDNHS
jgi:hypothetical protein